MWLKNIIIDMNFIIVYAPLKFLSLFHFYDTLMKMFNIFHIPDQLISRQAAVSSLIPSPFQCNVFSTLQPASATLIDLISDPRGCRSISKQFSIDSFFDREGHHRVFTLSLITTRTLSRRQHITR